MGGKGAEVGRFGEEKKVSEGVLFRFFLCGRLVDEFGEGGCVVAVGLLEGGDKLPEGFVAVVFLEDEGVQGVERQSYDGGVVQFQVGDQLPDAGVQAGFAFDGEGMFLLLVVFVFPRARGTEAGGVELGRFFFGKEAKDFLRLIRGAFQGFQ